MAAEPGYFVGLFNNPTVEAMHALSPREFERFVAYVLRRAGYEVKEVGPHWLRGVDLEMRLPGRSRIIGGVECKRFAPETLVTAPIVRGVRGAPAVGRAGAKPYVITTSDFNAAAHQMAQAGPRQVSLVNGAQFARYINYVRGSRHDDDNTITSLSPEFFAGQEDGHARSSKGATVLTIANNKGGVGKTTTAYYLGGELALRGQRVLLIDLDGQANLTDYCFPEAEDGYKDEAERFPNITEYFSERRPLHELVKSTSKERLSIIPSDPFLRLRDLGGSGRPDVETRFARDVLKLSMQPLVSLGGRPDWIIIDTPPAMSVFTRSALAAAHYMLAPVRPRRRTLHGTRIALQALQTMNALTINGATFIGTVVTHWDDLKISRDFVNILLPRELASTSGRIFDTKIPIDNQLESLEPGAKTQGARAYETLAEEVLRDVKQRGASDHRPSEG